jgi:mitogen-activated protein kinase 1/3
MSSTTKIETPQNHPKYEFRSILGSGAYGVVFGAVSRDSGKEVAIKRISPFTHGLFAIRTLREIKMLKFLRGKSPFVTLVWDCLKLIRR